jgi:hypothetical protein
MLSTRTRFNSYNYDLIPKKHKSTCDIYSQKSPAGQQEEAVEMMGVCDTPRGIEVSFRDGWRSPDDSYCDHRSRGRLILILRLKGSQPKRRWLRDDYHNSTDSASLPGMD